MSMSRYNRQELIKGWDQRKIERSSVAVIGSDNLAGCTSLLLTSLGVGALEIYDTEKTNIFEKELYFEGEENEPKVEAMQRMLKKINPYVEVNGVNCLPDRHFLAEIIGRPNVIMELTNNIESKRICLSYGKKMGIPVFSASASQLTGEFHFTNNYDDRSLLLEAYTGKKQGIIPSTTISGLLVENYRKYIAPLYDSEKPIQSIGYSLGCKTRFFDPKQLTVSINDPIFDPNIFSNDHDALIGAGALGNPVGSGLALLGFGRLDVIDGDHIEETNLNRQPFFYDAIGQMKASTLSQRTNKMNVDMEAKYLTKFLDENFEPYFERHKPHILIDCVDSLAARALINHYAVEHRIPLISGGTGPTSGQVISYRPGESSCLNCVLEVDKKMVEERTSHSCIRDPLPSVITSNETIAGIMLGETVATLHPEIFGESVNGIIKYDSTRSKWTVVLESTQKCNCRRGNIKVWMQEVMGKYKVN